MRAHGFLLGVGVLILTAAVHAEADRPSRFAFARDGARHDPAVRYRLPFASQIPRFVVQGVGGTLTHDDPLNYHAIDFVLPIGEPVLAAREGVVVWVVDGFRNRRRTRAEAHESNSVTVLHDDGTLAGYDHVSPGILVRKGDRVRKGQRLAKAGWTGGDAPHLHFVVWAKGEDGEIRTVPIRFGRAGKPGYVPQQNHYVGAPPRPNVELRVSVAGRSVDPATPVHIRVGSSVPLKVEARRPGGGTVDVTKNAATKYASMILWSMDVTPEGVVWARPSPGFDEVEIERKLGTISIFYVNNEAARAREREVGLAKVDFVIDGGDSAPTSPSAPIGIR